MLDPTPILPIRIVLDGGSTGTVHVGDVDVSSQVAELRFDAVAPTATERHAPRLTLQLWSDDYVIEGAAIVQVADAAGGLAEAAEMVASMDPAELKGHAAQTLQSGRVDVVGRVLEIIAERLQKASTG
jgi:hypothetical protein